MHPMDRASALDTVLLGRRSLYDMASFDMNRSTAHLSVDADCGRFTLIFDVINIVSPVNSTFLYLLFCVDPV